MKRFAVGCLSIFGILAMVGGGLAYFYVVRPLQNVARGAEQFQQIALLNNEVRDRSSFSPSEDDLLSEGQVERFMAVQEGIRERLQDKYAALTARYEQIESQGRDPNLRELMTAYSDLLSLIIDAKEAQVAELNEQSFSLSEYRWVKRQVFAAAGLPVTDFDLSDLTGNSAAPAEVVTYTATAPEENVVLLAPYREGLEDTLGLAFFGL